MREELIEKARQVLRGRKFINAKKLARKLGVSTHVAAYILRKLREAGTVTVWTDRRGYRKVYLVATPQS